MEKLNTYINEGLFKNVGIGAEAYKQQIEKWFNQNLNGEFERVNDIKDLKKDGRYLSFYYINEDLTIDVSMYGSFNKFNVNGAAISVPDYIKINKLHLHSNTLIFQNIKAANWETFLPKKILNTRKLETLRIEESDIDNKNLQNFASMFFKLPRFRRLSITDCPLITECNLDINFKGGISSTVVSFNGCNIKKLTGEIAASNDLYLDLGWNKNFTPDLSKLKMHAGTYLSLGIRATPMEEEINKLAKNSDIHSLSFFKDVQNSINDDCRIINVMGRFDKQFDEGKFRVLDY